MKQVFSVLLFAVLFTVPGFAQAQTNNRNRHNFYRTYTSAQGLEDKSAFSFAGNSQCRIAPTVQRSIMLPPHERYAYVNQPAFDFKEKKKRNHWAGMGLGILGGFIAGELIGYAASTAPKSCPESSYVCFDRSTDALISGILGAFVVGTIGGVIGIPISNDSGGQTDAGLGNDF